MARSTSPAPSGLRRFRPFFLPRRGVIRRAIACSRSPARGNGMPRRRGADPAVAATGLPARRSGCTLAGMPEPQPRPYVLEEANYRQLLDARPNVAVLPWGATE